jgi:hypothetical protein
MGLKCTTGCMITSNALKISTVFRCNFYILRRGSEALAVPIY